MFARRQFLDGKAKRRGIVLVLILGMLALLALIGVTFASISSQAQVSSRKFAEGLLVPDAKQMFDFGLSQLINDTQNPLSALMGHSLSRDMYGNDAGNNGGPIALNLTGVIAPNTYQTNVPAYVDNGVTLLASNLEYGKAPLGWILVVNAPGLVSQSLEVVSTGVNNNLLAITCQPYDTNTALAQLNSPGATYALDGRYQRAFNGSGQTSFAAARAIVRATELNDATLIPTLTELYRMPNFLYNDPFSTGNLANFGLQMSRGQVPMDEDYDACDLENMFLAIETADSSVVIPSFHRPGIVRYDTVAGVDDWTDFPKTFTPQNTQQQILASMARSRFLRPRPVDHPTSGLKELRPDPTTGKIEYDVDNDGDGVTDSVWLDLGFPTQRDANGKLYKPLFAFKVIGTNGKLPLNTVGNVQARALRDLNGDNLPDNERLWDHASHLGYSVNEINPKYALQNQPLAQFDNAGVSVSLTQLRNLLMGTRPQPAPTQVSYVNGVPVPSGLNLDSGGTPLNMDSNFVAAGSPPSPVLMPNNVPDALDLNANGVIPRNTAAVAGLWGEPRGVPSYLPGDQATLTITAADLAAVGGIPNRTYHSRVGPGRSPMLTGYNTNVVPPLPLYAYDVDGTNDSYSALDFYPAMVGTTSGPEQANLVDRYAIAPGIFYEFPQLPSERLRQFVTPIDASGNGAIQRFYTPPLMNNPPYDGFAGLNYDGNKRGYGADRWGRVSHFNYFRPAGVPYYIDYRAQYDSMNNTYTALPIIPYTDPNNGDNSIQIESTRHNPYHGFFAAGFPMGAYTASGGGSSTQRNFFADAFMGATPFNRSGGTTLFPNPFAPASAFVPDPMNAGQYVQARPQYLVDTGNNFIGTLDAVINSADSVNTGGAHPTIYGYVPYGSQGYSFTSNGNPITIQSPSDAYPGGSLGRDLAHEVNLYRPGPNDAPFGPSDLEWLYRQQDVDGANLDSRLKYLAPISFVYASDAPMRRKLFSIDSWELNSFVWANDNPLGSFRNNTMFNPGGVYDTSNVVNQRLGSASSASIQQLQGVYLNIPPAAASGTAAGLLPYTQAYAHRGRKINLNAPLPTTNFPDEEVRQKWVFNAYQALKQFLPPKSVDTPEELLALSQYVLNLVDFRDPDAAMTHFVNPDVRMVPPTLGTSTPAPGTPPTNAILVLSKVWDVNSNAYIADTRFNTALPIDQWGMEYPPLALNEVLAYAFNRRDVNPNPVPPNHSGSNTMTPRLWVELVNTLTQSSNLGGGPNPSSVDLNGWEIVIAPDDAWGRPNPFTGQINYDPSLAATNGQPKRKGNANDTRAKDVVWPKSQTFTNITRRVPALRVDIDGTADDPVSNTPYYYVVGPGLVTGQNDASNPLEVGMPQQPGDTAVRNYQGTDPGEDNPPTGGTVNAVLQANPPIHAPTVPGSSTRAITISAQLKTGTLFEADDDNDKILDASPGAYYWVYLRRPSNPLDSNSTKVVVDSVRVPYLASIDRSGTTFDLNANMTQGNELSGSEVEVLNGLTIATDTNNPKKKVLQPTANRQDFYSSARFQPYRGAQLIPSLPTAANTPPTAGQADYRYGFTEQLGATYSTNVGQYGLGIYGRGIQPGGNTNPILQVPVTNRIYHTLGQVNSYANNTVDTEWDHLSFHDRDFMSVYELTLVPACPPGLFTKQFLESPPNPSGTGNLPTRMTDPVLSPDPQFPFLQERPPMVVPRGGSIVGTQMAASTIPVYPYLSDNHFYSAEGLSYTTDNNPIQGGTPGVGGATGAGWHKMFELFEVPTSAMGAIGPVSSGANFDWYREDLRPGLINLNLIMDEEVFFGLIDDESVPKLSRVNMIVENGPPPPAGLGTNTVALVPGLLPYPLPATQPPQNFPGVTIPRVVTQVDVRGYPTYSLDGNGNMTWTGSYAMQNRGFDDGNGGGTDPVTQRPVMPMKAAFADFLKLRHGGSGFLFTHGLGAVGSGPVGPVPNPALNQITTTPAAERPFHSSSFPDINYTIMRPATLPPAFDAAGNLLTPSWLAPAPLPIGTAPPFTPPVPTVPNTTPLTFVSPQDPGVKHLYDPVTTSTTYGTLAFLSVKPSNPQPGDFSNRLLWLPPATPPRRLFQLPDTLANQAANGTSSYDTPASEVGDSHTRPDNPTNTIVSEARSYIPTGHPTLANTAADLAQAVTATVSPNPSPPPPNVVTFTENPLQLGGYRKSSVSDTRQHPIYRNEWMQKVANLTTVRTHQYAVWLTVAFFEVVKAGDPINLIPDELGPEIGQSSGNNVRFRGFFIVDRTRINGFDPANPADFRKAVAYSRRIE